MGQRLTADDFNSLFRYFTRTAFRLETQPVYTVAEEQDSFEQFLTGSPQPVEQFPLFLAWLEQIRKLTDEGKRVERVRIMEEPPTDYQRWELWSEQYTASAGEHIGYLPRSTARSIDLPDTDDWWLFDNQRLARMRFDPDGVPLGGEITDDPEIVAQHRAWQDLAIRHAIPAREYRRRVPPARPDRNEYQPWLTSSDRNHRPKPGSTAPTASPSACATSANAPV